jgi:hypothetical protein
MTPLRHVLLVFLGAILALRQIVAVSLVEISVDASWTAGVVVFFPICQVRVSRFYHELLPPSPSSPSSPSPPAAADSALNRERHISEDTAGPQRRAPELSARAQRQSSASARCHIECQIEKCQIDRLPVKMQDREY